MVMLVMAMSSSRAPSTVSSARPWQPSKTQLETVMFLKPPFDSVPNLMRPVPCCRPVEMLEGAVEQRAEFIDAGDVAVGDGHVLGGARVAESERTLGANGVVPGRIHRAVGDSNVAAAVDIDASRSVSIFKLSMVKLSTPVASMPKCPPLRIEKSRSVTLRQFFRLMDFVRDACVFSHGTRSKPRLRPRPQISPGPVIETFSRPRPTADCCASDCVHSPGRRPMECSARRGHRCRSQIVESFGFVVRRRKLVVSGDDHRILIKAERYVALEAN